MPVLDPGVVERVLENDSSICGTQNAASFAKLRSLLMMHTRCAIAPSSPSARPRRSRMVGEIVERLRAQIGDKLGRPAS